MNKRMIYLISLIAEMSQKLNIPKRYSKKFINSGNEYLSPTEKIRIEDLTDHFVTAGIVEQKFYLFLVKMDIELLSLNLILLEDNFLIQLVI